MYNDDLGLFDSEEEAQESQDEIHGLFEGTFNTKLGERLLEHLISVYIDRDMYQPGMTLDQVAFRQGEASTIKKIIKELNNG